MKLTLCFFLNLLLYKSWYLRHDGNFYCLDSHNRSTKKRREVQEPRKGSSISTMRMHTSIIIVIQLSEVRYSIYSFFLLIRIGVLLFCCKYLPHFANRFISMGCYSKLIHQLSCRRFISLAVEDTYGPIYFQDTMAEK